MSLGKGEVYSFSKKQNINGEISTEDELIDVYDNMVKILWPKTS